MCIQKYRQDTIYDYFKIEAVTLDMPIYIGNIYTNTILHSIDLFIEKDSGLTRAHYNATCDNYYTHNKRRECGWERVHKTKQAAKKFAKLIELGITNRLNWIKE